MLRGLDAQTAGRSRRTIDVPRPQADERRRERRTGNADDSPPCLAPLNLEYDLVADTDVRLGLEHVGVEHNRILVVGTEPASLKDDGLEQAGLGRWGIEREACSLAS